MRCRRRGPTSSAAAQIQPLSLSAATAESHLRTVMRLTPTADPISLRVCPIRLKRRASATLASSFLVVAAAPRALSVLGSVSVTRWSGFTHAWLPQVCKTAHLAGISPFASSYAQRCAYPLFPLRVAIPCPLRGCLAKSQFQHSVSGSTVQRCRLRGLPFLFTRAAIVEGYRSPSFWPSAESLCFAPCSGVPRTSGIRHQLVGIDVAF